MLSERFTTLDEVVKYICEVGGDDTTHINYGRVLKICVNVLRNFNLFNSTPYSITKEFEVLPNNTVILPKNAMDVLRVGVLNCDTFEEIFYTNDLKVLDDDLVERCSCPKKIQKIEVIGGKSVCDYKVEGIELCSGGVQPYYLVENLEQIHIVPEVKVFLDNIEDWGIVEGFGLGVRTNDSDYYGFTAKKNLNNITKNDIEQWISDYNNQISNPDFEEVYFYSNPIIFYDNGVVTVKFNESDVKDVHAAIYCHNQPEWLNNVFETTTYEIKGGIKDVQHDDYFYTAVSIAYRFLIGFDEAVELFDKTNEVENGEWKYYDENPVPKYAYFSDKWGYMNNQKRDIVYIDNPECEEKLLIKINGEWTDVTEEIVGDTWERKDSEDDITDWKIVDWKGDIVRSGVVNKNCNGQSLEGDVIREVVTWIDNPISCDSHGKCNKCGGVTEHYYGRGFGASDGYARNNLEQTNTGRRYNEQYGAKPYPAIHGYYALDLAKGIVKFSKQFDYELEDKVAITYSTDMAEVEGAKVVAVEWIDMLLYRCKELIWDRNSVDGSRQRMLYEKEYTRIKKIYNRMSKQEWVKGIMEVKHSSVKR